jgi:hypothetical protein
LSVVQAGAAFQAVESNMIVSLGDDDVAVAEEIANSG